MRATPEGRRKALTCAALGYAALMLWLLFGRSRRAVGWEDREQLRLYINLIPLKTIRQYLSLLRRQPGPYLVGHALVNLVGNVAAFVPLGLLAPSLWRGARPFWRFLLWTVALIGAVELLQLFTLRGSCDIDDLLLNVAGASLGYLAFSLARRRQTRIGR